jgi:hypothetical protein
LCRDPGPGFNITRVYNQGLFWANKDQKSHSGSEQKTSTPTLSPSNPTPFSDPYIHTIPTHKQHLCRDTGPCFSVEHAQTKARSSKKTQQVTGGWGQTKNMFLFTSLLQTASLCLPLRLLFPSHPRAYPNQHAFPSISPSPQAPSHPFTTSTHPQLRSGEVGETFDALFLSFSPLFYLLVTIYHWIDFFK